MRYYKKWLEEKINLTLLDIIFEVSYIRVPYFKILFKNLPDLIIPIGRIK